MSAGNHNFAFEQGADEIRTLTVRNDDGSVRDLTGYDVRKQVRGKVLAPDPPTLEFLTSDGTASIDGPAGQIILSLPADTSSALDIEPTGYRGGAVPVWQGRYDLELVDPAGKIQRLLQGSWTLIFDTTR